MLTPLCPRIDPLLEQLNLLRAESLMRLGWRHLFVRIIARGPSNHFTLAAFSDSDHRLAISNAKRAFFGVQAKLRFPRFLIRPMALITVIRENGLNIPIKNDRGADNSVFEKHEARRCHRDQE